MEQRCVSLHQDDPLGGLEYAWYYRCVRSDGHAGRHRGQRVDPLGRDVASHDELTWPDKASTNPVQDPDQPEHPPVPGQLPLDVETQT